MKIQEYHLAQCLLGLARRYLSFKSVVLPRIRALGSLWFRITYGRKSVYFCFVAHEQLSSQLCMVMLPLGRSSKFRTVGCLRKRRLSFLTDLRSDLTTKHRL